MQKDMHRINKVQKLEDWMKQLTAKHTGYENKHDTELQNEQRKETDLNTSTYLNY